MGPLFIPPSSKLDECSAAALKNGSAPPHSQDIMSSKHSKSSVSKGSNLRKYVVIAQDCVAVKMTSINGNSISANCGHQQHQRFNGNEDMVSPADNGVALFKLFLQSNSKCHWNTNLVDSLQSLQYKGHITPNIILIYSSTRHLNTLRTAWSRRILREPPGYKLEMLGDIEEIFTQPIGQSQFAPLSDSLCWAIMHLCSNGSEAFVDSIIATLGACFPGMEIPSRELVFQTLEKLIKEQKIYQTANGYFIVTPEVSSYMAAASSSGVSCCSPIQMQRDFELHQMDIIDRISISQQSWGSVPSLDEPRRCTNSTLKRHNSLKVVSKRDEIIPRPHMGARSLSFRLSKRNSLLDDHNQETTPTPEIIIVDTIDQGTQVDPPVVANDQAAAKKRRSLFSRLFSLKPKQVRQPQVQPQDTGTFPSQCQAQARIQTQNHQTKTKASSSTQTQTQSQSQTSSYSHRRHSLIHIPDRDRDRDNTYELLQHQHRHHRSHSRSSSLSHHHHRRTRSRASSPCSNISNIYASLRCTPTADSEQYGSRRLSRASVHDLYRTNNKRSDKDITMISTITDANRSTTCCNSSDDVSH